MLAKNLPGGPRRYHRKCAESSSLLVQARNLPGGPRRYCRKSAGKFICTGAGGSFQVDLEGTIEKVQESSSLLVQARNLPDGPN